MRSSDRGPSTFCQRDVEAERESASSLWSRHHIGSNKHARSDSVCVVCTGLERDGEHLQFKPCTIEIEYNSLTVELLGRKNNNSKQDPSSLFLLYANNARSACENCEGDGR